jgi:hypothetical protein
LLGKLCANQFSVSVEVELPTTMKLALKHLKYARVSVLDAMYPNCTKTTFHESIQWTND